MKIPSKLHPATITARANGAIDIRTGGVVPSLGLSTTFVRDENNALLNEEYIYGRDDSATVRIAEDILSKLEEAQDSALFPTGMAAIAAVIRIVKNDGCILLQSGIYWGTTKWVRAYCQRQGISLLEMDCADTVNLISKINARKPDLVFVETPSNPWLKIVDIGTAAKACNEAGALLVVDSTAATPILTRPLSLGAHIVVHSATKAINGHSDLLAGVVSCADKTSEPWQAIRADRHDAGAIIGNFEAWLLIRAMRTLPLRIERMCENAMAVAQFLHGHKHVEQVFYPGLPSHQGHQLAASQMRGGFGFLMSILVHGDRQETLKICGSLNLIHRATSLGGVESLVEHRQTVEPDIPDNLLRFSIGIEHAEDLIADLDQALRI